ncbi:hypothetical protein QUB47_36080 [Microcoleus sp. AT9_B5]
MVRCLAWAFVENSVVVVVNNNCTTEALLIFGEGIDKWEKFGIESLWEKPGRGGKSKWKEEDIESG